MAFQLIYTSSPTSLTMGRTGFSTVARSKSMPEKLASAVERCGVYDVGQGEVFSHTTVNYGGETWHVLTRMCDAGTDYTNRNNYIAHHIVIAQSETAKLANPAEILAQWNGWLSKWEGEPRFVGNVDGLEKIAAKNSLPAKNWERIFGNPAKAALLDGHPATICADVSRARTLLDLFSESLLLNVNPLDAWEPTFTTSRSENDAAFLWRAAPDELSAPINLSAKSAPPAPQSRAAQYAATGVMTNREKYNLKVSAPKPATRLQVVETKQTNFKPLYAASAAITLCAIAAAAWLLLPAASEDSAHPRGTPSELPKLELPENRAESGGATTARQKPKSAMTLSQTMEIVRGKIAEDKYEDALKFWDESPKAAGEPSLRRDILEDIATRADVLMRQAENLLAIGSPSKSDIEKVRENVEKAARALAVDGIERIEARKAKLKTLNDTISTK